MRKVLFVCILAIFSCSALASHITGGEMIYEYLGAGSQPNTKKYRITLKLFRDQYTTGAPMPVNVYIGIFNNDNNTQFPASNDPFIVTINERDMPVDINPYPPCVVNPTPLEYNVGLYSLTVELPDNLSGYTAAYQTCCRISPLNNVFSPNGTGGTGSTYSCVIPVIPDSSPAFSSAIDLICYDRDFSLDFSATDADGDSLVYAFAEAYNGGIAANANNINPASPSYSTVTYLSDYTRFTPLGDQAVINPSTGVISGIAPSAGRYVVCVSVKSFRNGSYIGEHRKDFIVNVGECDLAGAELLLKPVVCDGFEVTFSNNNPSSLNKTFYWEFGDPKSGALNTSTQANPTHQFSDTGVFVYKLVVNRGDPCSDSATQTVKVYPGFSPGFFSTGQCRNAPIRFTDTSKSRYGTINAWSWNFGDPQKTNDTSHVKSPSYVYENTSKYDVKLTVTDSKGCTGTATVAVDINNRPDFTVSNDTLICSIDTLSLHAEGMGTIFWTPNYNISNQNSLSPLVSPDVPTKYYANFSDAFGCEGQDSVFVDVRSFVSLDAGRDTGICATDAVVLNPLSDALHYQWSPSAGLDNDTLKRPTATPLSTITYSVTGSIGKCRSTDVVTVKVSPYPAADAGMDTTICLGASIRLNASGGSFYRWSPAFFLDNPNIASPLAAPVSDMNYIVTVSDTLGCAKSVRDSVNVRVLNVIAEAGPADTSVVMNQPLQLNASGGEFYLWSPPAGLSNNSINNPVARLTNSQQYVVTVREAGCLDTDTIRVTVFKIEPGLYVPNAFTPGGDGRNDVFRPIPVGMKSISYFRIYNRWGKLMFSSAKIGRGWDGMFNGKAQDAGLYVWTAEGIDYLDNKIIRKGSVVLIR